MSWRTVVITSRCKLDYKLGYMYVRGEDTKQIFLDEIAVLVIENCAVSITGCLISALAERKVKVIFCDERRNPETEMVPLYGSHDCSRKLKTQIGWSGDSKGAVWTAIVSEKIRQQAAFLTELGHSREAELLTSYLGELAFFDETNREGHAAKVYFNALFGMDFTRSEENAINLALNYGYSILTSAFSREIVANGYSTELGLYHSNMFNFFNLSCDLVEPFRILVDRLVVAERFTVFETEQKHRMLSVMEGYVQIGDSRQTVLNAIKIYTRSVFDALNERDVSEIKFYKNV